MSRWMIIALCAAGAIVLGLLGFIEECAVRDCAGQGARHDRSFALERAYTFFNNLWRTFALFAFETDTDIGTYNWKLVAARILAPIATAGALLEIASKFFGDQISLLRARWRSDHIVIMGYGEHGRRFLDDCRRNSKQDVIVVDRSSDVSVRQSAKDRDALFIQGDARETLSLRRASLADATQLIIVGGYDAQNLEVLNAARAIGRTVEKPLRVLIRIDNRLLVRQLEREDTFARDDKLEVTPFNVAAVTARQFFADYPLVDLATLRAQQRVHLVCVGWTAFVFEVLEQLARLSPYRTFDRPRVDLLVRDPSAVGRELESIQPALGEVLDLTLHDLEDESGIPTPNQIEDIEPGSVISVTAILVSLSNDATTAGAALAMRERTHLSQRWRAPVFAHLTSRSALSSLIEHKAESPDPCQRIVPVGFQEDACSLNAILGERERLARLIHESYLSFKGIDEAGSSAGCSENEVPWESLKQTYRLANRRAADHFPIKILSVGAIHDGAGYVATKQFRLSSPDWRLEDLAELEHKSWEIDRKLDGWRLGKTRDDAARIHPALQPFSELTEGLKDFDRDQIRAISDHLLKEGETPTVRYESRIGLFGHNAVTSAQRDLIIEVLDKEIISDLLQSTHDKFISVCTPLAPGSDAILAKAVLDRLAKEKIPHRLIVIRTLPLTTMIDAYKSNYEAAHEWRLGNKGLEKEDWIIEKEKIERHLQDLMLVPPDAIVADLVPPGQSIDAFAASEHLRTLAYRKAAAWLVEQCDTLVAFSDSSRTGGPGGTAETLDWARGVQTIPASISTLRKGEKIKLPRVITIDC